MFDCVYPLSPGPLDYSELRYSLRTLDENTGAERVWFMGGRPDWLKTGLHVRTKQPYSKWRNVRINIKEAVANRDVSDPFLLLNDDHYILAPVGENPPLWHGGYLLEWLIALGPRHGNTQYVREGRRTAAILKEIRGSDFRPLSWSLHTPILVYKDAMRDALDIDAEHGGMLHLRSLYGNLAMLDGEQAPCHDVKSQATPKYLYASSSNASWPRSPMGRAIRARFTTPSRWES